MRADLGLIGLDDEIERSRVDVALFRQDGLERAHAQLHLRELRAVLVVMMVVVMVVVSHGKPSAHCVLIRIIRATFPRESAGREQSSILRAAAHDKKGRFAPGLATWPPHKL